MKVLLINPSYPQGCAPAWIPWGLLYIASFLEKNGIEVKIIDNAVLNYDEEKMKDLIKEYNPDIVGTGGMTVQANNAIKIGRLVKMINKRIKLVYGGVHFTFVPEDGLKYGDIVIIGEGEETSLEICNHENFSKIKGICFLENGKVVRTERREQIKDLDSLPFPVCHLIEMKLYHDFLVSGERAISILTGRGCPYNCIFCASPQLCLRKVRYHSLDYVLEFITYLKKKYDLQNLRIMDDTFTLNKTRVLEFCERMKSLKLNMTCLTHIGNGDVEMFMRMKEANFSIVAFGIESGNEKILKLINKNITKNETKKDIEMAKKAGLDTEILFMIGNISENKETIIDSINFAKELKSKYFWFQYAIPFPGSKFFEIAPSWGRILTYNYDLYHHQRPIFIPHELDEKEMIYLRKKAFQALSGKSLKDIILLRIKAKTPRKVKNFLKKLLRRGNINLKR